MKKLYTLLGKGNLTPKERVLLLVHNNIAKNTTGKEILTEVDKHAICEGWKPKDNNEVREYNKYNDCWQLEGSLKLDAQTMYLNAQNALLRASRLVDYAMWTDCKNEGGYFRKIDLGVDPDEALKLIIQNSGLVFDQVMHRLTFQNLTEDIRQDILKLCPDAETESQYLDQEEQLAELFNGKLSLTTEAKERLADLILAVIYNKYAKILLEKGLHKEEWWFQGYFAELPTIEIAKKCAEYNSVSYEVTDDDLDEAEKTQKSAKTASQLIGGDISLDKEFRKNELSKYLLVKKIHEYAEKQKVDMSELLKQTILRWLDEGLFTKEYSPICNSTAKNTCNDVDTKMPHKEILKMWLKTKLKAKEKLQKLASNGQLKVEFRDRDFYGMKEKLKIITGESLYKLEEDFVFVEDYKKQADNLSSLGSLILFVRDRGFLIDYASLLAVADIYKKLSKVYEIDIGYKINDFIDEFKKSIQQLNNELRYIADKLEGSIHTTHNIKFPAEIFLNDMMINLEQVEPSEGETETHYLEEFKKSLDQEFQ